MGIFYNVRINFTRNSVRHMSDPDVQRREALKQVKLFHISAGTRVLISDEDVPDSLVSEGAIERYLAIEPPQVSVMPEFDPIINEIEKAYVLGLFFSALSAACVSTERLLNTLRIRLHPFHPGTQQGLKGVGPIENWKKNIDALVEWGYLAEDDFAEKVRRQYRTRSKYLHSGPLDELGADALSSITLGYELLNRFLGFPESLFRLGSGIECLDPSNPLFIAFYKPTMVTRDE